jgi:cephalosporin hydroxylase
MLSSFCDNRLTDKNTTHSYIDVYEKLFSSKRQSANAILEIGIGPPPTNGGSAKLWAGYFENADVHIIDIISLDQVNPEVKNCSRIFLHTSVDAYDPKFFINTFLGKGTKFDIVLDDGPHTLDSMVSFIKLYSQLMKEDGILVIEDVQDWSWIQSLKDVTDPILKPYIEIYDRRYVKGRYDDIMFVINKSKISKKTNVKVIL